MKITGQTSIYGIIGCPVKHSLSPVFQSYFAKKYGMSAVYVPFHVEERNLQTAITGLGALGVQGVNITVPYKEKVLPFTECDGDVVQIGAANTLHQNVLGDWQASNTDWKGVAAVLQGAGLPLQNESLLLFGAGGTSRAVLHAVSSLGFKSVGICNRSPERVSVLLEHVAQYYPQLDCFQVAWNQQAVSAASKDSHFIVNTTSIGLVEACQFPFELGGSGWAMDAVYKPAGETPFTLAASQGGRLAIDGLAMLIAQGASSFNIWHPSVEPDKLDALMWMEHQLGRKSVILPGWEGFK